MALKKFFLNTGIEAGVDEAGRGALAGPVVAAAVILPQNIDFSLLDDSKKCSPVLRADLEIQLQENAVYGIGMADVVEIAKVNILKATFLAMHRAIAQLKKKPDRLLIDGNRFVKYLEIDYFCLIKADAKYQSVAAASILAKNYRDRYMSKLAEKYPDYDFENNKGYGSQKHIEAIQNRGISLEHRSFFCKDFLIKKLF